MLSVFENYDTFTIICNLLSPRDQAALARTSSRVFQHTIPILWYQIQGVTKLLALIPSTIFVFRPSTITLPDQNRVRLPERIDSTRLRVYAPHIRVLQIHERPDTQCFINDTDWTKLVNLSIASPLLPNLTKLTLHWNAPHIGPTTRPWQTLFLTSSLIDLQTVSWMPPTASALTQLTTNDGLREISEVCPQLQTLAVFPFQRISFFSETEQPLYGPYISCFSQLRTLSTSLTMLQPEPFLALSRLPYLKSLAVYASGAEPPFMRTDIAEKSFESLRRLEVHDLLPSSIEALWSLPFVVRLTQVTFQTSFTNSDDPWLNVARTISNRSPLISELHLDFGIGFTPLLSNFLKHFQQTRLTTLIIDGRPQLGVTFPEFIQGLPSFLEVLKIRWERTLMRFMPLVASHLPRLRILAVDLTVHDTPSDKLIATATQVVEVSGRKVPNFILQNCWEDLRIVLPDRKESIVRVQCEFFPDMDRTVWEKRLKDENGPALCELNQRLNQLRHESL
ncbi:hypothetical protein FRC12_011624 [Ceratobasidium sp. 428]|nr:hypothetical protein FRC12_011624 [Ceratobasidium sp. 428]